MFMLDELGRVVGITFDFAFAGLLVEAFDVAIFADVQRSVDKDFEERKAGIFVNLSGPVAILTMSG